MAKRSGDKRSKKLARASQKVAAKKVRKLEKALAAALVSEARQASRLEAARAEVGVLRAALAEVGGSAAAAQPAGTAPVRGAELEAPARVEPAPPVPEAAVTPEGGPAAGPGGEPAPGRPPRRPRAARPAHS